WQHTFSEKVFTTFTLSGSHYFNFPSFKLASTYYKRSNHIYDFSFRGDATYSPNSSHKINAGFRLGSINLGLRDKFDGRQIFTSNVHVKRASVYFQDQWSVSDHWKITPGFRLTGFDNGHYLRFNPRLSVEYIPADYLRFQAAFGR